MRVLLIGAGAREHAIAWRLRQSPDLERLLLLPGNPGMAALGETVEGISPTDVGAVAAMAAAQRVDLTVVGPEDPLAAGITDALARVGVPTFGPTRSAAQLESSKAFAKEVMRRAGIPTAEARVHDDPASAHDHLAEIDGPFVVKADGLAAGKGVLVTDSRVEAGSWVDRCFSGDFGEAGSRVVIEEYLQGPELSVFALSDGVDVVTLQPARDYKRLSDGDRGPNTGGMGSYSPVDTDPGVLSEVERTIIRPTIDTMAESGVPYVGFLYAGLALTADGPRVIEFNCRLGDPETQVVLPRLGTDLLGLLAAGAAGSLPATPLDWIPIAAVNVVMASAGYPESPRPGETISGLHEVDPDVLVFHAGTERRDRRLVTAGGRVLSVVGTGADVARARARAYAGVEQIRFRGCQFRTDIAAGA